MGHFLLGVLAGMVLSFAALCLIGVGIDQEYKYLYPDRKKGRVLGKDE